MINSKRENAWTSSIVPIPMALPRRPYLLGLFPATSNDWATQDGAKGRREGDRGGDKSWKKQEREKKEHIIRSHAQSTKNFNSREQNSFKRSLQHNLKSQHEEKEIVKSFTGLIKFEVKHRSAQQEEQHSRHAGRYCPKGYKFVYWCIKRGRKGQLGLTFQTGTIASKSFS